MVEGGGGGLGAVGEVHLLHSGKQGGGQQTVAKDKLAG